MKTIRYLSVLFPLLLVGANTRADSTLEYLADANKSAGRQTHSVLIKSGKILIQAAEGSTQYNLLYQSAPETLFIIDHKKRSVQTLNEQQINSMAKTSETVQPLLQGFSKQLAQLDPQQRAKWQQMLGNSVSLDKISEAAKPPKSASLLDTGKKRTVSGISCKQINVLTDNVPSAELCLASQGNLHMNDNDYATFKSLFNFADKVVTSSRGLASQFGVNIPSFSLTDIDGIPVAINDLNKNGNGNISLQRLSGAAIADEKMQVPQDYKSEAFALFK
ncbi:hypothetical protein F6R98_05800 [Candidatus Methylospira mobilis]|uniref:DUF4412 domain-containing protein n=1 Tax=Candidatus Methylospira mobilis TaxID=1808979 RepID=A0A5Q0BEA4_9GAMM|nr:hypothetical protein [Candidatus Methylospira mobilis]QFY42203.1 hypothetical protein F6R98_05800 [Candidatus Methylospira mobilis]WNV03218.1 hypothetical protein RP726_12150 [Candidatus Methylospira mobilis]